MHTYTVSLYILTLLVLCKLYGASGKPRCAPASINPLAPRRNLVDQLAQRNKSQLEDTMENNADLGSYGQKLAEDYLIANSYQILETNFRCHSGEIDIIARDGAYIAFVEVKYRRGLAHGYPREAVGPYKQRHIRRVAEYYIMKNNLSNQDFRFDVLEIIDMAEKPEITLISNAF